MSESGWTLDSLKAHLDAVNERQDTATAIALTAAKEAVGKAEAAISHRLDETNEFRGQLKDQAATFARSDALDALAARVVTLEKSRDRSSAALSAVLALIAIAGVLFGIINTLT